MIDLTPAALAIIALCAAVIASKVGPWVKANVSKAELEKAAMWAEFAVNAAEKLSERNEIKKEERYDYVSNFLKSKGYHLNLKDVEVLIEGYCNKLPKYLESLECVTTNPAEIKTE